MRLYGKRALRLAGGKPQPCLSFFDKKWLLSYMAQLYIVNPF